MRLSHAFLVIVDISGYTEFITKRTVSLLHAEQVITELMESLIDRASHPLLVNKLEGDAALLYRECAVGDGDAGRDVLGQVRAFFDAFHACLESQRARRAGCGCDACTGIGKLALKAFVHVGEIAIKQVRQFEELAGEEVILIHRLLKNQVPSREYVLLTEPARALAGLEAAGLVAHMERLEGVGERRLWLARAADLPMLPPLPGAAIRAVANSEARVPMQGASAVFHHMPDAGAVAQALSRLRRWWGGAQISKR